jgi:hypothetical protein
MEKPMNRFIGCVLALAAIPLLRDQRYAPGYRLHTFAADRLGLSGFTGFVKITSTNPIISLSLNAEAFPVIFSASGRSAWLDDAGAVDGAAALACRFAAQSDKARITYRGASTRSISIFRTAS